MAEGENVIAFWYSGGDAISGGIEDKEFVRPPG